VTNWLAGNSNSDLFAGFGWLVATFVHFDGDALLADLVHAIALNAAIGATVEAAEAVVGAVNIRDT